MSDVLTIRPMTRSEVDFAVDLAAAEGWNPGLHDAEPFYTVDPDGFFIGLVNNRPVGCISAVSYGNGFGFMGFYIILPEHRSKGYGMQLWEKGIEHLKGHNIGGDGVFERLEDYRRSGFAAVYSNIRFEYLVPAETDTAEEGAGKENVPVSEIPFAEILRCDRECFPAERQAFLERWLAMPESYGAGRMEGERLRGYGVIRTCRQGYKIGPLFADNAEIADSLFRDLVSRAEPGLPVYLDVPEVNVPGMELAQRYGMRRVFGTGRIYSGGPPDIAIEKVFGVTSFELG